MTKKRARSKRTAEQGHPKLAVIMPAVPSLDRAPDALRILPILKPQVLILHEVLPPKELAMLPPMGVEELWLDGVDPHDYDQVCMLTEGTMAASHADEHEFVPLYAWWDGEGNGGLRDPDWGGRPTKHRIDHPDDEIVVAIDDLGHSETTELLNVAQSEEDRHDRRIVTDSRAEWMVVLAGLAESSHPEAIVVGELPTVGAQHPLDEAVAYALRLWYLDLVGPAEPEEVDVTS